MTTTMPNPPREQIAAMKCGASFEAVISGNIMNVVISGDGASRSMTFCPKDGTVSLGKATACEGFAKRHNARFARLVNTMAAA